jgi:hypothetical protein
METMRFLRPCFSLLVILCVSTIAANATVSALRQRPSPPRVTPGRMNVVRAHKTEQSMEIQVSASLRQDVSRHPNEFVVFETLTAASHFMQDHLVDVSRETEPRMIQSGVVGYWRGKTLVVLPIVSSMSMVDDGR